MDTVSTDIRNNTHISHRLNNRIEAYVVLSIVILSIFAYINNAQFFAFFSIIAYLVGAFLDPIIPLCISLGVSPLALNSNSIIVLIEWIIISIPAVLAYVIKRRRKILLKDFIILLVGVLIFFISYLTGYKTNQNTVMIQTLTILMYVVSSHQSSEKGIRFLRVAFLSAGYVIALCVSFQMIMGRASYLWGVRLTYNGSVRTLSTNIAFPILYLFIEIIDHKSKKISKLIIYIALLSWLSALLLFSYSRGVLISVGISAVFYLITKFKRMRLSTLVVSMLVIVLLIYLCSHLNLSTRLMLGGLDDGSGRLSIWLYYWSLLKERGIICVLCGFGPGDIKRIVSGTAYSGLYSHSLILDYLFTYGIFGFAYIVFLSFRSIYYAFSKKNMQVLSLLLLYILMFSTHSNSAELGFHVMLGLTLSMTEENSDLVVYGGE